MKNISIKRKALTCLSTAALMAAMVPGIAMAEPRTDLTADVTLTHLHEGDTVAAYEIVDSQVDSSTNDFTRVSKLSGYSTDLTDQALGNLVANVSLSDIQSAAYRTKNATANAKGEASFTGLDDGSWLFIVTNANGSHRVYQNTVVNTEAKQENKVYVAADPQTVEVKYTESPKPSKTISINGEQVESGSIQLGQTYDFSVSFGVPTYPDSAVNRQLVVTDTPTGFKDDVSSIVVKNGNDTLTEGADKDYTVAENGVGFTVTFTDAYIKEHKNQNLVLTYKAMANSVDALTGAASNKVDVNENYDQVDVKTYGFYFEKTGKDGNPANALPGATFTLKKGNDVVGTCTSDENGYVYFSGLQDGVTYTVSETHVPTGYQAAKDFTVTISKDSATGDNPATTDKQETNFQKASEANVVVDAKQGALPTTGGAGTIGLTVAGVVLVAGGATLVLRARKNNE